MFYSYDRKKIIRKADEKESEVIEKSFKYCPKDVELSGPNDQTVLKILEMRREEEAL